jgi:hypothetical protein
LILRKLIGETKRAKPYMICQFILSCQKLRSIDIFTKPVIPFFAIDGRLLGSLGMRKKETGSLMPVLKLGREHLLNDMVTGV